MCKCGRYPACRKNFRISYAALALDDEILERLQWAVITSGICFRFNKIEEVLPAPSNRLAASSVRWRNAMVE
jgi:hypothetical protein